MSIFNSEDPPQIMQGSFAKALGLSPIETDGQTPTLDHVLIAGHLLSPEDAAREMERSAEERDDAYSIQLGL